MTQSFDNSRPIYLQIAERITSKIVVGEYPIGTRLASVRELAAEAGVNPNTMQRALAALEQQGLLYTERTAGRFVTQDKAAVLAVRDALVSQMAADFTKQMAQMGYTTQQLITLLQAQAVTEIAKIAAFTENAAITDGAETENITPITDSSTQKECILQGGTADE